MPSNPAERHNVGKFVRQFFTNWSESNDPFAKKLALTVRNRAIAFGHRVLHFIADADFDRGLRDRLAGGVGFDVHSISDSLKGGPIQPDRLLHQ